jgi:NAD(P)-dependent dehydrogenase (short-subunit alcohol dehydrogenase family)
VNAAIRDWQGRRVWIVGASSGIGEALARALLASGARVAVSARSREKLEQLTEAGGEALVLPLDVTDHAAFGPALDRIVGEWGGVDLVAFVAGAYTPVRAWDLTAAAARAAIDINLLGPMAGTAAVLPRLLAQGSGALAYVSSVAGYRGLPKALTYGPTKAALINFAETLRIDLAPRGIAVFLVSPGFVATRLTAQNDFNMPALITPEEAARHIVEGFARGRFEIHFPKRFTRLMKLLEVLPYGLYFRAVRALTGL